MIRSFVVSDSDGEYTPFFALSVIIPRVYIYYWRNARITRAEHHKLQSEVYDRA